MKERFTVLMVANDAGQKEKLWIVGKSKNPKSFPKCQPQTFIYKNNAKGWMTSDTFVEFLNYFNNKM